MTVRCSICGDRAKYYEVHYTAQSETYYCVEHAQYMLPESWLEPEDRPSNGRAT